MVRTIPVDLAGVDVRARRRRHLVGTRVANIFHVQGAVGAHLEVRGREAEGFLELIVSGRDSESTDKAVKLCTDPIACSLGGLSAGSTLRAGRRSAGPGERRLHGRSLPPPCERADQKCVCVCVAALAWT